MYDLSILVNHLNVIIISFACLAAICYLWLSFIDMPLAFWSLVIIGIIGKIANNIWQNERVLELTLLFGGACLIGYLAVFPFRAIIEFSGKIGWFRAEKN